MGETKYQTATEQKYSLAGGGRKPIGVTATSELHEMAVKKGVRVEFKFLEPFNFEFKHQMRMWSKDEMRGNYKVQLNVAGYEFFGQADLPQTAKHNAASQAMAVIRALPDPGGVAKVVNPPLPGAPKVEPVSVPISLEGKNVNMALNEIAMCNGCVPEWTMIGEHGPPHQKTFTWQLTLGEFSTTGTGPNKKLARNVAAEQMMAQLPEEWKSKRSKSKKSGAGNKRPGFGSRLQNHTHHHHVTDDVPVFPNTINFSVPPPRIILPTSQGPLNVEEKSQTDVKVTILKSPDVGGDEETQTTTLMKRPAAAPCNISRSEVESIRVDRGGPVKSLQQREKEYEEARQRILGSHEGNLISSTSDEVSVDDDEVDGRGGPSPKKKSQPESEDGKVVIAADNPVSCLYEYAKKVKIPDPEFSCIAENLLETWQKANQTFKKIEYTIQLKIDGKTYLASSNQKKAAKQATAAEAWNAIRATLL